MRRLDQTLAGSFWRLFLALLCGLLSWAATPGLGGLPGLAGIALAPLFIAIHRLGARQAFLWALLGGVCHYSFGKWSTFQNVAASAGSSLPDVLLVLMFFCSLALPYAVFAAIWARCGEWCSSWLRPWCAGFGLAAMILLSPKLFPYTPVVLISSAPVWLQLADLGGEALLLGLLLTVNAGAAALLIPAPARRLRQCGPGLLAIMMPLGLASGYAAWLEASPPPQSGDSVQVLSLQSHWPSGAGDQTLLRDSRQTPPRSAVELTRSGVAQNPSCQLVLWPETPRSAHSTDRGCTVASQLSAELQRPILANCHAMRGDRRVFPARLYTPAGLVGEHQKSRLIPVFESPLGKPDNQGLTPGSGTSVLRAPGLPPMTPSLCFEVHFAEDLRHASREGAQAFLHMANFSLFRSPLISHWDLAMTRIRAVENRRSIVRSVNAGLAGAILPSGEWVSALPAAQSGTQCHTVPLDLRLTFFSRHGHAVFWSIVALIAVLLLWPQRWRRPPQQAAEG